MSVVAGFSLSGPANAAGEPDSSSALLNAALCALSCSPRVGGLVAGDDQHVHVP